MTDLVGARVRFRGNEERGTIRLVHIGPAIELGGDLEILVLVKDSGGNLVRATHQQVVIVPA